MGAEAAPSASDGFEDFYRSRYGQMVRIAHMLTSSNATAEVLGCSTGTVKSQLHRAPAQLKDLIER